MMGRWAFVAVFFILTLLPGLQMLTHAVKIEPIRENRELAPPADSETPFDQAPKVWDRWFGDHFGFREWLIELKTQIDFSLFGTSDRVLIGREGQLFLRSVVEGQEPWMERLLATQEEPALRGIQRLCHALKEAQVRCVFVINMMSDRYYPELLPPSVMHRPPRPSIDNFVAGLKSIPDVLYVDSDAILRSTMRSRRIFHKTDFHWNDAAAFPVARALVDQMNAVDGRSSSSWTHQLEIRKQRRSGGIAMFMPLFVPPTEDYLMVKQNWTAPDGFHWIGSDGPFEETVTATPDPRLLPPTVLVGDSFLDGMWRAGLSAQFVEVHRIRWKQGLTVSGIIADMPGDTRWLVVQFIEVSQPPIQAFADPADIDAAVALVRTRPAAIAQH